MRLERDFAQGDIIMSHVTRASGAAWSVLLILIGTGPLRGQDESSAPTTPTAAQLEAFEKDVRPLLVKRCDRCHGAKAKAAKGGFRLDSREGLLRGGARGPAVVPGHPEKSLLIQAVRRDDPLLQMPPSGPLSPHEVEVLEEWVRV